MCGHAPPRERRSLCDDELLRAPLGEAVDEAGEVLYVEDGWRGALVAVGVVVELLVGREGQGGGELGDEAGEVFDVEDGRGGAGIAVGVAGVGEDAGGVAADVLEAGGCGGQPAADV
jgi:hypothetical protein